MGEEIDISSDMYSLLRYAEQLYQITDGLYDVTVGSLVIENGFGPANTANPNTIPVSKERFDLISNNRIIKNDNFQFDLSSIAKGYAVDSIAKLLINSNRNNFLIEIGGEIIVNGSKHGVPWVIGIQDPSSLQNQSIIEISRTGFLAIATSGEYRNTNINDAGEIISHTFNPINEESLLDKSYSVTVASEESSMRADAWATALNVLGPDRGIKLANSNSVSAMYLIEKDNIIMKSKYWNYSD